MFRFTLQEFAGMCKKWDELGNDDGWIYIVASLPPKQEDKIRWLYVGQTIRSPRQRLSEHKFMGDLLGTAIQCNVELSNDWVVVILTVGECALTQNRESPADKERITDLDSAERYLIRYLNPLFNWGRSRAGSLVIPDEFRYAFEAYAPHIWRKTE